MSEKPSRPEGDRTPLEPERMEADFKKLQQLFGLPISFAEIKGELRNRPIALVRHILMWAHARGKLNPASLPRAAEAFGRTHATLISGLKKLNRIAATNKDPAFDERLELLLESAALIADDQPIPPELVDRVQRLRNRGIFSLRSIRVKNPTTLSRSMMLHSHTICANCSRTYGHLSEQ